MKHKSELVPPPAHQELLLTPTPASTTPAPGPTPVAPHRKKPHTLPPLDKRRNSSVEWRPRGSPPPAWRRPSLDEQLLGEARADRPAVRVSRCPDLLPPPAEGDSAEEASIAAAPTTPGSLGPPLLASKYAPLEPIRRRANP